MGTVRLIVLEHASPLGNASAQELFELLKVEKSTGELPPRDRTDYAFTFAGQALPAPDADETREIRAGIKARFFPVCWRRPA
jgi:hypothetical protein